MLDVEGLFEDLIDGGGASASWSSSSSTSTAFVVTRFQAGLRDRFATSI